MRRTLPDQLDLVPAFHTHVRSREFEAMSQILDAHPEAAKWVVGDLVGRRSSTKGREGIWRFVPGGFRWERLPPTQKAAALR